MELDASKPPYDGTLKHFVYGMSFRLTPSRRTDLETILATFEIHKYRLTVEDTYAGKAGFPEKAFISFRIKKQAMLFKLAWTECEAPPASVILPVIRRVMPKLIAQDIIGVQPMTAPNPSIYALRLASMGLAGPASSNDPSSVQEVRSDDEPGEESDGPHL